MKTHLSSTPSNQKKILKKTKTLEEIKTKSKDNENLFDIARTLYEEKSKFFFFFIPLSFVMFICYILKFLRFINFMFKGWKGKEKEG